MKFRSALDVSVDVTASAGHLDIAYIYACRLVLSTAIYGDLVLLYCTNRGSLHCISYSVSLLFLYCSFLPLYGSAITPWY